MQSMFKAAKRGMGGVGSVLNTITSAAVDLVSATSGFGIVQLIVIPIYIAIIHIHNNLLPATLLILMHIRIIIFDEFIIVFREEWDYIPAKNHDIKTYAYKFMWGHKLICGRYSCDIEFCDFKNWYNDIKIVSI